VNFQPTEEQTAVIDAVARVLAPYRVLPPAAVTRRAVYAADLERTLVEGGYFDVGAADPDSRICAALIVAEISKLPVCIEAATSLLVKPIACPDARGPVAIITGDGTRPARFLPQARTALIFDEDDIRRLDLSPGDVVEVPSIFAYPVGTLKTEALTRATALDAPGTAIRNYALIGLSLEIHGALHAASALTIDHVTQRRQFRRPIGAFQAIQHRLAMNATSIEAIRWLALNAAFTGSTQDALLAAAFAQQSIPTIVYDLHQFSGAMGLTLEYPLHLYTYRARMLQSDFGGAQRQAVAAANEAWPEKCRISA